MNRPPTLTEIAVFPELAVLALVDHTLATTIKTMKATHRQLDETMPCVNWNEVRPDVRLADDIILAAEALQRVVHDYHEHMSLYVSPPPPRAGGTSDPIAL